MDKLNNTSLSSKILFIVILTLSTFHLLQIYSGKSNSSNFDLKGFEKLPDFSQYSKLRTLSSEEFPIDDPHHRVIIVGDIHGNYGPFQSLLERASYDPSKDSLIHVGDFLAKGPYEGSMATLKFMASKNITGVRGNHDQKIIEWRGWSDWITSMPGGKSWLDKVEEKFHEEQSNRGADFDLDQWIDDQKRRSKKKQEGQNWWARIPEEWTLFSDHYRIARKMSQEEYEYMLSLPVKLHAPAVHVHIVHGGLLPSNPKYPYYDKKHQPLASPPSISDLTTTNLDRKTIEMLRSIQEQDVHNQVPQNTVPWVTLNIRSVVGDEVTRDGKVGKAWSKLWNHDMELCRGFTGELIPYHKRFLPCYPSTVIYGHAASRGLDIKRWSLGIDSGCVYGRKLTALVIGGKHKSLEIEDSDSEDNYNDLIDANWNNARSRRRIVPFGDNHRAKIVQVKCPESAEA